MVLIKQRKTFKGFFNIIVKTEFSKDQSNSSKEETPKNSESDKSVENISKQTNYTRSRRKFINIQTRMYIKTFK